MASFCYLVLIMMALMASSSQSLPSDHLISEASSIFSAPALQPNPPLPPDVAPLLPSPRAGAHPPTGMSLPTIPSDSTQNPDMFGPLSPDAAVVPSGVSLASAAMGSGNLVRGLELGTFLGIFAYWLVLVFVI